MFKKMLRTMWKYRAQFISMVIMIALGIGVFVGFNIEWYAIEQDTAAFFEKTGLSDFRIISEKGVTEEDRDGVSALFGEDAVARVLSVNTTSERDGDVLSLTVTENPKVSGILLTAGAPYDAEDDEGFWLSDRYAEANGLAPGDAFSLSYKGLQLSGTVRGLVKSGEYLICLPDSTQLMPDYSTSGFVYVSPAFLSRVLHRDLYTEIRVRSSLGKTEFSEKVRGLLGNEPLILGKEDTVSYSEAMGESTEGKTMASVLPVLFLAIAILTMVTTMHRLTASEKTQIGTLKSLGFRDRRIVFHYSFYALFISLTGTALGILLGYFLGWFIMNPGGSMGTYFDMDDWSLPVPSFIWIVLVLVNLFMLFIGFLSVRSMLKGSAADALRPYSPKAVRNLFLERFRFFDRLPFGSRWNLRDSFRHKARTGMSLFGIIGCMVLLVGAFGMQDTMNAFVETFYHRAIGYETRIYLDTENENEESVNALSKTYTADRMSEATVLLDEEAIPVEIYRITEDLVRFIGERNETVRLSDDGVYVCSRIAREHHLKAGDRITFSPLGSKTQYSAVIAGTLRSLTKSLIMTEAYAKEIGLPVRVSALFTAEREVRSDPLIESTQTKQSVIDSFDTFMEVMNLMVFLLVIAAVVLGIVVLYNLGVMSYTERYREMATLKVIGFRDRTIGKLLIGQNFWMTVIGTLVGIPAGIAVLKYLITMLASEYEMDLALGVSSFVFPILLTFGVSLAVGFMIAWKNRKINMVEALKTAE